jgi:hypothetical protein
MKNGVSVRRIARLIPSTILLSCLLFSVDAAAFPGAYYWKPRHDSKLCVTAHGGVRRGAPIDVYQCIGASNQRWYISIVQSYPFPLYNIHSQSNSDLCVDMNPAKKGEQPKLWTCTENLNQQFLIMCGGNNNQQCTIRPNRARSRQLSVKGGFKANNTPLILWNPTSARDQVFDFRH